MDKGRGCTTIARTAIVEGAILADEVCVGEYAVIGAGARIGRGSVIHPHAVVSEGVELGEGTEVFPGAFLGKEPKGAGALAHAPRFERRLRVGRNTTIGPGTVLYWDVEIGEGTLVGDGASIREQCRVGSRCLLGRFVTLNYEATVGDRTKIMDYTHITGRCHIGSDVFISVHVSTTNDNAIGQSGFRDSEIAAPVIEDGAALGAGAILLPGVRIGAGAVVGAGSVVTRDVAPRTRVMGVPARPVGAR